MIVMGHWCEAEGRVACRARPGKLANAIFHPIWEDKDVDDLFYGFINMFLGKTEMWSWYLLCSQWLYLRLSERQPQVQLLTTK